MDPLDMLAKMNGFEDAAELHRMVASVAMSTDTQRENFIVWKETDGTKEGLQKLIEATHHRPAEWNSPFYRIPEDYRRSPPTKNVCPACNGAMEIHGGAATRADWGEEHRATLWKCKLCGEQWHDGAHEYFPEVIRVAT